MDHLPEHWDKMIDALKEKNDNNKGKKDGMVLNDK